MITFICCVALLLVGYLLYGKYVTKVFGPDERQTPDYSGASAPCVYIIAHMHRFGK